MSEPSNALHHRFGQVTQRRRVTLLLLALALLLCFTLDLQAGPAELGLGQVLGGLFDPASLELRHRIILWDVRLPDAVIALAVGAALGLAGIETQTILDNPLASPFTLGVSSSAMLGASIAIVLAPTLAFLPITAVLPLLALVFSLASGLLILAVVRITGGRGRSSCCSALPWSFSAMP
ncbi:iron chelate uptake ABC transporter family permease subunit [Fodinicurvata halophila]|uniref:iron chelate uptake ABC transporter family permease subunit n=1 Tax=Fodinicurvata halophila TaxID=1419723 RepID=UPI0036441AD7